MPIDQAYNYKSFSDLIDTAGVVGEERLHELAAQGYTAVVDLLPHDSQYAVADEPAIVEGQGLDYYYIPVDFAEPKDSDYQQFAAALNEVTGRKALLHCAANFRVSAFTAIYAFRELGWSVQQSEQFIADIWDTAEHPQWQSFVRRWLAG